MIRSNTMNILYYSWGKNSRFDLIDALSSLDHMVNQVYYPTSEYLSHPQLEQALVASVLSSHSEIIFTFNYLPLVTKAAERADVRYVCWVFDCPHYSLFSPLLAAVSMKITISAGFPIFLQNFMAIWMAFSRRRHRFGAIIF